MPAISLNMIVKNEAPVIRRCLESARPWIQAWTIVDTGSSDGTQDLVREILGGVPGALHERPWRDFGSNRTEAIRLAGPGADYLLFLDADEELEMPAGYAWPVLGGDAYSLLHRFSGLDYHRAALAATRIPWQFEGVLHEYLDSPEPHRIEPLHGPVIRVHPEGARSSDPLKYAKDAAVLEEALLREPGHPRHTFYLAQSYRDAGELRRGLEVYERRILLGGWAEEVWYSMYQAALLRESLGAPRPEVLAAFLRAYEFRPGRPETLGQLARFCRLGGEFHLAHLFAERAISLPPTQDVLFVEPSFTLWRNKDEYAVACYWTGRLEASAAVCRELLGSGTLPESERARVAANLAFATGSS